MNQGATLCPGWIDQDGIWYGGIPRPRPHCIRGNPAPPPNHRNWHSSPLFSPRVYCG